MFELHGKFSSVDDIIEQYTYHLTRDIFQNIYSQPLLLATIGRINC
jgi:hypothetical protein